MSCQFENLGGDIFAFICGTQDECEHSWDGEWVEFEDNFACVTCSKCGSPYPVDYNIL